MALLEVSNLKKSFGKLEVLKTITLNIEKNDVVAVIGPSGSGKSTMLRSLIHLEEINGGSICVDGDYLVQTEHMPSNKTLKKLRQKWAWYFNILIYSLI